MAGYNLTIEFQNAKEIVNRLNNDVISKAGRKMIDFATLLALSTAKQEAPVRNNILRGSITRSILSDFEGKIGTNVEYAKYQEFGTGIYGPKKRMIVPKRAAFLVFKNKSGKLIFAKKVRGTKPKKFMQKGLQSVQDRLDDIKQVGFQLIKQLTGL